MQTVTTIGLDIAKSVFQVHDVDAGGQVVRAHTWPRRRSSFSRSAIAGAAVPMSGVCAGRRRAGPCSTPWNLGSRPSSA